MKKNFLKRISLLLLCVALLTKSAYASTVIQTSDGQITEVSTDEVTIKTNAKSAVLLDASNGEILYEENKDEPLPFASITKIMTMLLTMEAIDNGTLSYDQVLVCSERAKSMGGSEIWLEVGEEMTVSDLLKAVAVNSANDAAVVLAEAVGGTEENFINMMNKRAKELGMVNTTFKNTNGLPCEGHLSTAYDISLMSKELLKHKKILNYTTIWTDTLRNGKTELTNTNKLVRFYKGATGLKTGFTDDSGYCLSASAERNGLSLIAVVLGCETSDLRFNGAKELLNYGFSSYKFYKPEFDVSILDKVKVILGTKESVSLNVPELKGFVIKKTDESSISYEFEISKDVKAPVDVGQTLGKLIYKNNDKVLATYDLKASESVSELKFGNCFCALFLKFIFMR